MLCKYFESKLGPNSGFRIHTLSIGYVFDAKDVPNFNVLLQVLRSDEVPVIPASELELEDLIKTADFLKNDAALYYLSTYLKVNLPKNGPKYVDRQQVLLYLRLYNILLRTGFLSMIKSDRTGLMHCCQTHATVRNALTYDITPQLFISYHFKSIMYEREVLELSYESIYTLLVGDYLRISEEDVVRTIKMWINYDYTKRRRYYGVLLRCVRFDAKIKVKKFNWDKV